MKYWVHHTTRYDYSETVPICYNRAHLTPRERPNQFVRDYGIEVIPVSALFTAARRDYFGNEVTYFTVQEPHNSLTVALHGVVEVTPPAPRDLCASMPWENVVSTIAAGQSDDALDAYQFTFDSRFVKSFAALRAYALKSFTPTRPVLEATMELTRRIYSDFTYDPSATTVSTPLEEVMSNRRGVCQDFAHLQIGCLRSLGLAARYVSGYIYGGEVSETPHLTGAQASHAWLAVFCPAGGWVDFDPTNNMMPADEHITLAWGRDFDDVSPVRGVVLGGGEHTISVAVHITRES